MSAVELLIFLYYEYLKSISKIPKACIEIGSFYLRDKQLHLCTLYFLGKIFSSGRVEVF